MVLEGLVVDKLIGKLIGVLSVFQILATKERVESVKEFGMTKVNSTLETPLAKFALEKINEALTVSEEYVEKYLPPSDEELTEKGLLFEVLNFSEQRHT